MRIEPGIYQIKNAAAWTNIDETMDGPSVIHGWRQTNLPNQYWRVQPHDGKSYTLQNAASGSYLHAGGPYNGCKLVGSKTISVWFLDQPTRGEVHIVCPGSSHVVDLANGNATDGTTIQLWEKNTSAKQQQWYFERVG